MKHRTAELEGALLDASVAMAEGGRGERLPDYWRDPEDGSCWVRPAREEWAPSRRWDQGGPIIERERIDIKGNGYDVWFAGAPLVCTSCNLDEGPPMMMASTPLIAAMRAYVASKFGEEVDLP